MMRSMTPNMTSYIQFKQVSKLIGVTRVVEQLDLYIAFYAMGTANWGMAAALGIFLLTAAMALYAVYSRLSDTPQMTGRCDGLSRDPDRLE